MFQLKSVFQLNNNPASFLSTSRLFSQENLDLSISINQFLASELDFVASDLVNSGFSDASIREGLEALGADNVAIDIEPLTAEPVIDVANGIAESASVELPVGPYRLEIGSPFGVGSEGGFSIISDLAGLEVSELSSIIRNDIDADSNDNDAEQILAEILTGESGAFFDFEREPGIDGVELVGLTPSSYTIAIQDGDVRDDLTLGGPGVANILGSIDADANIADGLNSLSLVDLSQETIIVGADSDNPLVDVVGSSFEDVEDVQQIFESALSDRVSSLGLISVDDSSFSVRVDNPFTEAFDLLVFFDSTGNVFDALMV